MRPLSKPTFTKYVPDGIVSTDTFILTASLPAAVSEKYELPFVPITFTSTLLLAFINSADNSTAKSVFDGFG